MQVCQLGHICLRKTIVIKFLTFFTYALYVYDWVLFPAVSVCDSGDYSIYCIFIGVYNSMLEMNST